eukprot:TRINITY_DN3507_c0_g1_i1.p1 TRINITY_DN3507_c0_g1~~TRINITY_DN3507_c0_g1_i1.p1  ORF type:complete len:340 (+),score=10.83 TRINITY_DN3507_c0_g1_i1:43-1062(+)
MGERAVFARAEILARPRVVGRPQEYTIPVPFPFHSSSKSRALTAESSRNAERALRGTGKVPQTAQPRSKRSLELSPDLNFFARRSAGKYGPGFAPDMADWSVLPQPITAGPADTAPFTAPGQALPTFPPQSCFHNGPSVRIGTEARFRAAIPPHHASPGPAAYDLPPLVGPQRSFGAASDSGRPQPRPTHRPSPPSAALRALGVTDDAPTCSRARRTAGGAFRPGPTAPPPVKALPETLEPRGTAASAVGPVTFVGDTVGTVDGRRSGPAEESLGARTASATAAGTARGSPRMVRVDTAATGPVRGVSDVSLRGTGRVVSFGAVPPRPDSSVRGFPRGV